LWTVFLSVALGQDIENNDDLVLLTERKVWVVHTKEIAVATVIIFHEVEDAERWANAWKKGTPGNRHEMFADFGTMRTFRDPMNPNSTGLIAEIPDMEKFQALMNSDMGRKAMEADGLKFETLRLLLEFTP
jgi:hypothetical protein